MFFGREEELNQLDSLWRKRVASLVTCRGRRRIGKSALIEEFAHRTGARFIKIEGKRPQKGWSNATELQAFAEQLAAQTGGETTPPSNWLNAFIRLSDKVANDEKTVMLLDEISWLGHFDETFSATLKIAWDNYFKKHDRLVLVVCGSVSGWIRDNIIDNGAFVGRRSLDIVLRELPPAECAKFWGEAARRIDTREIVDVLSITGGVPRYLEEIDPALSASENIKRMCYLPNSILRVDFDDMFNDVITEQPVFTGKVLRLLVDGPKSVTEVADALGTEKSGRISKALDMLAECGLVSPDSGLNPETGVEIRERRYRLRDNYSRFYLKFVEPVARMIDDGSYRFGSLSMLDGWNSVMGLAFENLVVNNYVHLLSHLHLGNTLITSAAPYRKTAVRGRSKGCQVDLLIQAQGMICIVEVKRCDIDKSIIAEVDRKVSCISRPAGVSIRTALVFDGTIAPTVEANGYFDAIIPFPKLLGLERTSGNL